MRLLFSSPAGRATSRPFNYSDSMIPSKNDIFGFEAFADIPAYQQVNASIIQRWLDLIRSTDKKSPLRILDLATGKGTIPRLILERWPSDWPAPEIVCLDQKKEALAAAREELAKFADVKPVLVNSPVQELSFEPASIDLCTWGNGIHYLDAEAQVRALVRIKEVLRPGGWFAFNTAFHREGRPAQTHAFYQQQIKHAVRALAGISREKKARPPAGSFMPRTHYEDIARQAGLDVVDAEDFTVPLDIDAMEKLSSFPQYAAGALHGYPTEPAMEALTAAVAPAMTNYGERDENDKPFVSRVWLAIAARRVD
jgi:ubiquinone/menaquinone biosynthesis C-methylase UbiE